MRKMVKRIRLGKVNAYLIVEENKSILVDAGTGPKDADAIEKALAEVGLAMDDLVLIIVTHVHYDHVGGLKSVKERSGAPVLVHAKEKEILNSGFTPFPRGTLAFSRLLSYLANKAPGGGSFASVEADRVFHDELDLSPFGFNGRVLHTPGHTPGSATVVLEEGVCLVGDTLFHLVPWSVFPPFAEDESALFTSWKRLLELPVTTYYPGHGRPIDRPLLGKTLRRKEG
jgi:glyoxylase-like metal-dependent hydrolase (beta-lactamase superfamily II)